ncbi:MAG: 3-hydroxybutyrate dehydrogenase [Burkholderiales bacterium]
MLKGKSVVVTGATSGIGLGIARAFASQGCNVMINGLGDSQRVESLRAGMAEEFSVTVLYSSANMAQPAEIGAMIDQAARRFGAVDVLVNNAGIQHVAAIEDFAVDQWDQILAVNLSAAFHAIRVALPGMKKRAWGRILNIASVHGLVASPFKSAYVAAKHGMVGLTKTVALETAGLGVTCNAICPGFVLTPLVEKQIEDQAKAHKISREETIRKVILERQPSKAFVEIDQVAAMAVYLAGDAAASITGASMSIDGGWAAQ